MAQTITHHLVQAARAHRSRAATELARIRLHPGQDSVLKLLGERDGRTMGEIAEALAIQPPTVTKMVTRLSCAGLVERRGVQGDMRKAAVYLTTAGRGKIAEIDAIWNRLEARALSGFCQDGQESLRQQLTAIETNLSRAHSRPMA